jgi:hypothetical protein
MKEYKHSNNYEGMSPEQEIALRRTRDLQRFSGPLFDVSTFGLTKSIGIVNSGASEKAIAIFTGSLTSIEEILEVAGVNVDAIAAEGTVGDITVTGEALEYARRFFNRNPTRVIELQVSVSSQIQLSRKIRVFRGISPFGNPASVNIVPKEHQKSSDSNVNLVSIPIKELQIDDQSLWVVNVAAGQSIDITIFTGAGRNDAQLLSKVGEVIDKSATA